eukprot:TRINITY_DN19080_c0_g1::TRINITY_DN19080_c0_g1_i1::g.13834::m.13834 TRINITY_DN19080_c0_g1::TRINITY_DN19080_c0_g1_i1::g.13834  ORF type:complete len:275 (-),score=-3.71,cNMP_binding/PF00027.24/0.028,Cupin_3/PF05899.7/0.059 TRINITY_DN19080_c0_g1_i1:707-1531(-)
MTLSPGKSYSFDSAHMEGSIHDRTRSPDHFLGSMSRFMSTPETTQLQQSLSPRIYCSPTVTSQTLGDYKGSKAALKQPPILTKISSPSKKTLPIPQSLSFSESSTRLLIPSPSAGLNSSKGFFLDPKTSPSKSDLNVLYRNMHLLSRAANVRKLLHKRTSRLPTREENFNRGSSTNVELKLRVEYIKNTLKEKQPLDRSMEEVDNLAFALRPLTLFADLDDVVLHRIARYSGYLHCRPGQQVFEIRDDRDFMCVVLSGSVTLVPLGDEGQRHPC